MKKSSISTFVPEYLKQHAPRRFKAIDIAEALVNAYPEEARNKLEKSSVLETEEDLIKQYAAEIGAQRPDIQKKNPHIRTTDGRPKNYYYDPLEQTVNQEEATGKSEYLIQKGEEVKLTEKELYPILGHYLSSNDLGLYVKRIDETKSKNSKGQGGNKWLHPDMVALEDLTSSWREEVKEAANSFGAPRIRLWAFEVKLVLNSSNVRESYFQAVSNSTWSNQAYLVASEIDSTIKDELDVLFGVHGVGVILLDVNNQDESQILIPAKERPDINWASCNRLAEQNPDFQDYLSLIDQFLKTGKHRHKDWDYSPDND